MNAVTEERPATVSDRARENREYVRQLLWRKQPEFAAALEEAVCVARCPVCGAISHVRPAA